ncbi:MAG: TIGR01212 family radical SAM protein [Candidatus Sumerlaeaceae bacterium]|nr:TIGR01212 family radical SAM protein [Candidatus Sumerlaeaceae bacterium]
MILGRYRPFHDWLLKRFGERVFKICLDAGFTCPNRDGSKASGGCTFCDLAGSGARHIETSLGIRHQVQQQIQTARRRYRAEKFIAYFQAFTNTYAPVRVLKDIYDAAFCDPNVVGLSIGTRGDCVTDEVCELIAGYKSRGPVWLELGLQSVNQSTLDRINRAERVEDFVEACESARKAGVDVVAHLIFGLPGDTREDCLKGVRLVNECGCRGIKIHNLYIDANAPMAEEWQRGEIQMIEREEYISWVCDALEILDPGVLVHRLTGEASPKLHLAPQWSREKVHLLRDIERELERRGSYQGKALVHGETKVNF